MSSLPDISNWNINKVIDISFIFYDCSKLSSLPDISNWNTNNVINMSNMFYSCSSLTSLPDISKWNTNNVNNMSYMFSLCNSCLNIPAKFFIEENKEEKPAEGGNANNNIVKEREVETKPNSFLESID